MKSSQELFHCDICKDEGWVCEDHETEAWKDGNGCCGAAGKPCKCNKKSPPWYFIPPEIN